MAPITRSRLRRQRIEDVISISSTSTSTSPVLIQPQPSNSQWHVTRRNDTSVSLSFIHDRNARVSEWLARLDSSDASTISNGDIPVMNETQPFDALTISNEEVVQYDEVEIDVANEPEMEEYEIDDELSENDFVHNEMLHPLTFVNYLNTLEDEPGGINCSLCNFSLVHSKMGHATAIMCGHVFHEMCIQKIQTTSNRCPKCRQDTREWDNERIYF